MPRMATPRLPSTSSWWTAAVLAVSLGALVACDSDRKTNAEVARYVIPVSDQAARKAVALRSDPAELPANVGPDDPVVMLLFGVKETGEVVLDGAPIEVAHSSLRLDRAMAKRRHALPRAWCMIREDGAGEIRYWIPLDPAALVRANLAAGDHESHGAHLERVPVLVAAHRMPFFTGAELEIVRARDGTGAGRFRFGPTPESPLEKLE